MSTLSRSLLAWYDRNRRSLPWRDVNDPYRTWLSEIMLQQTQSETVIRYYDRFLSRFPTVFDLAQASEDEVLKLWEGLGYYSRARNLHKCAKVLADNNGVFPSCAKDLERLPGVGPYTARAIASIAFNEPVPALDGNQMRVLSRVFAIDRVLKTPFDIETEAVSVLDIDRPGDYNQALMDLGASICVPKSPSCGICPLNSVCIASKNGCPEQYPFRPAPIQKKELYKTVLIVHTPEGVCVRKRTEKLLGGLYEFPTLDGKYTDEALSNALKDLGFGNYHLKALLPASKHTFTHLIWRMTGRCIETDDVIPPDFEVVDADRFASLAFPSALRAYTEFARELLNKT